MNYVIVIPARMASSRFPGKPLALADGKPLLWHTVNRARFSKASAVIVATPDQEIKDYCESVGVDYAFDRTDRWCGTARVASVVRNLLTKSPGPLHCIVNWQVDEPEVPALVVDSLAEKTAGQKVSNRIGTLCCPIQEQEVDSTDEVKVIVDKDGRCRWFSRGMITGAVKHVGIYAVPNQIIWRLGVYEQTEHSRSEDLEQLTWLENDEKMFAVKTDRSHSINTPADLEEFDWRLRNA